MPAFNWQIALKYNSTNDTWEKLGQIITTDSVAFDNATGNFRCIGRDARLSHDGKRMAIGGGGDFASQHIGIIEYDETTNTWNSITPLGSIAAGKAGNGGQRTNNVGQFSGDGWLCFLEQYENNYGNQYLQVMKIFYRLLIWSFRNIRRMAQ